MAQQISPFIEAKYGWGYGADNWDPGMDENLLKFSFMFDGRVDGIVASLPAAVNGQSYFLTTDNRFYFAVGTTWYSSPCPQYFVFKIKSTGDYYQYDGSNAIQIDSPAQAESRFTSIEVTLSSLGTAAFEDVADLATQAELDVASAQANAYTDTLRSDIADPNQGAAMVAFLEGSVSDAINTVSPDLFLGTDEQKIEAAYNFAATHGLSVFIPPKTYIGNPSIPAAPTVCLGFIQGMVAISGTGTARLGTLRASAIHISGYSELHADSIQVDGSIFTGSNGLRGLDVDGPSVVKIGDLDVRNCGGTVPYTSGIRFRKGDGDRLVLGRVYIKNCAWGGDGYRGYCQ